MVDRYRNYQPYKPNKHPRRSSHKGLFAIFLIGLFAFGGTMLVKSLSQKEETSQANSTSKKETIVKAEAISTSTWNQLSQEINALIAANPQLDISVAVIDVRTNTKGNYGIQDNFAGASTTKVLTAAAYLHDVETNQASLTDSVNGINAQQQIKQMINRSNNESWEALNQAVGYGRLENYAHSIGMSSYKYIGNLMTASDEALLLQKLYSGELLNDTHKQLLLSFMQNTNNEDMIPVVKPEGASLYHKYGQLDGRLHDAAIIDYKDRPIVIVIYTKGAADTSGVEYATRTQLIQNIARTALQSIYPD